VLIKKTKAMTTKEAKDLLRQQGYFMDNLWNVLDVTDRFDCSDETAQDILYQALTNSYIVERIHETIRDIAMEYDLREKGGDE
jgi:hypothetical protein